MSGLSVSSDDVIAAYQEKLSEANYEVVLLRARLAAMERREQAQMVQAAPSPRLITDVAPEPGVPEDASAG